MDGVWKIVKVFSGGVFLGWSNWKVEVLIFFWGWGVGDNDSI